MRVLAKLLRLFCAVLLCSQCGVHGAAAGALSLNGQWSYADSKDQDSDFRQNYNASYSGRTDLTDNITMDGSLRYSKRIEEDYDSDIISPALTLNNFNDIYSFSLYGNYSYRTDSKNDDRENWFWSSRLGSSWINRSLPTMSMSYGQRGAKIDSETTSRIDFADGRVGWAYWNWMSLYYSFDWNRDNAIEKNDIESENLTQRAGLRAAQSLFSKRLRLGLTLNYLHNKNSFSGRTGEGGFALLPAIVSQASYEETTDPLTGALTNDASFLLTDEDPPVILEIKPANEPMNLGVNSDFQQVDVIYLTAQNEIDEFASNFSWDLYSSDNGIDWVLEEASLPFVYDDLEQRFEFEVDSLDERWLKLVADTGSLLPTQVTEIVAMELFRKIFGEEGGSGIDDDIIRETYQSRFNLAYQLMQNLRFNYNFSYDRQENSAADDRERIDNNGALTWSPGRYFAARINASENRDMPDERPEKKYRRYGLSLSSSPLDTLDVSLGATRNENYEDSDLYERYNNYSFNATAQLYDDLDSSLDLNYTDAREGFRTDTFSERLQLTARLRPSLIFTLDQRFSRDLDDNTDAHRNDATLNWRLSEIMYVNNTLIVDWGDESDTSTAYRVELGIAPNRKNRVTLSYNLLHQDDTDHFFTGIWSWLINPVFNFNLSGNYGITEEEDDQWSFQARLNYHYTKPD